MATRSVATVFGGSGFIGRYVVKRLAAQGYVVRVAGRDTERAKDLMTTGRVGQVVPLYVSLGIEATIAARCRRGGRGGEPGRHPGRTPGRRFRPGAGRGAGADRAAAAAAGVRHMVQISAIGADSASDSQYARSKAQGEAAVLAAMPGATILRPSIVFGAEDKFFNRFGAMAMSLPVMPVIHGATRFQPVYVGDVADAAVAALSRPDAAGTVYELGGPRTYSFRELLAYILQETRRHRLLWDVPLGLARIQARLGELVPGKPFTRDQLTMLAHDNVAAADRPGLAALGVVPTPVELVVPEYLDRYREGGGKREEMPA